MSVEGCRFLVTGASSGIGLELSRALIRSGAEVCLVARRRDLLAAAVDELGARSFFVCADLADPEAIIALGEELGETWDRLDGLVNNAAIAPSAGLIDSDVELIDRVLAINLRAPMLLTRAVFGLLRASDSASIVNVSSNLAVKPIPGMVAYNASKAGLNSLTKSLALELAPQIRVNAVMPGVVDTPIHLERGMSRKEVESLSAFHPLGRIGQPGEVASAIMFLLDPALSSWTSGAIIAIDGAASAG